MPQPIRASLLTIAAVMASAAAPAARNLPWDRFSPYIERFNRFDRETKVNAIPNAEAARWLRENIPLFECSDNTIEETYYFRWWAYRKHVKQTPDGFIVTEFLPDVPWAGKSNSISCPAGHHFYEGRWLRAPKYLDDYSVFWFRKGGEPRRYSFWAADSIWARYLVTGDRAFTIGLLDDLAANYREWEKTHLDPGGLYWQIDDRDGMEVSIGGSGYRATINSYQAADAAAISRIARLAGRREMAVEFEAKSAAIVRRIDETLWDPGARFFKVLPRGEGKTMSDARELHGYVPWYFHLARPGLEEAWKQITDPEGFAAPYGPTTAERRHPRFRYANAHDCQWNGPSWPFATTQTLVALANVLNDYQQDFVTARDYVALLSTYAKSQRLRREDGTTVPWIDENLDPFTGDWLARRMHVEKGNTSERGKDYNHSGFADLVISGAVGLRPRAGDLIEVNPLAAEWDYFALTGVRYRGHDVAIYWDKRGSRYGFGPGLRVFADGALLVSSAGPGRVLARLPGAIAGADPVAESNAGWMKSPANPVIGGKLGTVFDVAALTDAGRYRMWVSWRPKASVALVESTDGIHWSEPEIVLGPNPATAWEGGINRPAVVKRRDGYHMWYTGQTRDKSFIGYATSADGRNWKRMSAGPVLLPEQPWEKVAVMCPHVIWDEAARLFRMWYSGGEQYEPDAIGYATSPDGLHWTRHARNPVFAADSAREWESHKVTACQVVKRGGWHYMFYIGFRDVDHAQIGVARSRNGTDGWERNRANPILRPGEGKWDHDACYKPFAVFDGKRWLLWYNGRRSNFEQIGLAIHQGEDLGFGK